MPICKNKSKLEEIKGLIDRGYSNSEIARELNTTYNSIHSMVNRHIGINKNLHKRKETLIRNIKGLIEKGYTNPEIATRLGYSPCYINGICCKFTKGNKNYNKKRLHINSGELIDILLYRRDKGKLATIKKFGLTEKRYKSILAWVQSKRYRNTKVYRLSIVDKRTKAKWGSEEYRFVLQNFGLIEHDEIGRLSQRTRSKNKRRIIKELLSGNLSSFPSKRACFVPSNILNFIFSIPLTPRTFTWIDISSFIRDGELECKKEYVLFIDAMAMFQSWVHKLKYKSIA